MKTWKNPRPLRPKSTRPKSTRPDAVAPGSQDPRPSSPTLPQHRFRGEEVPRGHHAHAAQARGDAHLVRERAVYHASVGVLQPERAAARHTLLQSYAMYIAVAHKMKHENGGSCNGTKREKQGGGGINPASFRVQLLRGRNRCCLALVPPVSAQ